MIEFARAAQMATVVGAAIPVDLDYRRVMELAGLRLVRTGVGDGSKSVAAGEERVLHFVLNLSVRAALPA
jgi:hypothetical protein